MSHAEVRALLGAGRVHDARAACRVLLRRDSRDIEALRLDAVAAALQKDFAAAITAFERALQLAPEDAMTLHNYGAALIESGRPAEALASLRRAVELRSHADWHCDLGTALALTGALEEALAEFRAALELRPESVAALRGLGSTLNSLGLFDAALEPLQRVVASGPEDADAFNNLGIALQHTGRLEEALAAFERALTLDPTRAIARFNYGVALLKAGDFARGWEAYESRLAGVVRPTPPPGAVHWVQGLDALDRPLRVVAEQGLGDAIQFVRYGALLRARGVRATLQCDPRLVALLATADGFDAVVPHGEAPSCPAWLPLLSLPRLLGTRVERIPARMPYLRADPARAPRWRARLEAVAPAVRVGIAWQGNPGAERGTLRGRSVPLAAFAPLAALEGVRLVSLQVGAGGEQLAAIDFAPRVLSFGAELDAGPQAFLDTAAILDSLDLVVTSDTALAHLAGALGRPVWVALHTNSDWRWLTVRSDSPWYPTMRLFRQSRPGDWAGVFAAMAGELAALIARRAIAGPAQQNGHTR